MKILIIIEAIIKSLTKDEDLKVGHMRLLVGKQEPVRHTHTLNVTSSKQEPVSIPVVSQLRKPGQQRNQPEIEFQPRIPATIPASIGVC